VRKSVIIADPEGKGYEFAKQVYKKAKQIGGRRYPLELYHAEKTIFRDGEVKIKISDNIRGHNCFYIHDSNKHPTDWFLDLGLTLQAIHSSSADSKILICPYMRFARQDRKDESRISVASRLIAEVTSIYINRGLTVDLHASGISEYFNCPFDNLYSFPYLINHVKNNHPDLLRNLSIVSPDIGGAKRASYLRNRFEEENIETELVICHKDRDEKGEVEDITVIGDVTGRNCLIVDDIISSGKTAITSCNALKNKSAKKISFYGTHGLFTDGIEGLDCFDRVIVSDTLKTEHFSNLEILSLVDLFGEAIYRTIEGDSLSDLFGTVKGI
jgi:ribose-phosphate pyrophosphokinase